MASTDLSKIYDSLFLFESRKRKSPYPIHKKIKVQGKDLLDWILSKVEMSNVKRVLDAGCGTGYSLFTITESQKIHGVGLSLSADEIAFANRFAVNQQVNEHLSFHKRDFTEPLDDLGCFDLVLMIESLKHCPVPETTVKKLLSLINKKGKVIIADDYLKLEGHDDDVESHKFWWSAPGFQSISSFEQTLKKVAVVEVQDLSEFVPRKSAWQIATGIFLVKFFKFFTPNNSRRRTNLNTYLGALILESLYISGKVGYFLVTIEPRDP